MEKNTQPDAPKIGIFDDIGNEEYHRGPGISKSGLDLIQRSPAHYRVNKLHPKPSTPAMFIGSAFHALVLEPEVFEKEFILYPADAPKRPTKAQINAKNPSPATLGAVAWWENFEQETAGKTVITNNAGDDAFWSPGDWDRIHLMRDAVADHPIASILLDPDQGRAEHSVFWIDDEHKKLCKCRPDFLNDAHNIAVDLKSTNDASFTAFAKSAANWRYHVQESFYMDGLAAVNERVQSFIFVAVEKEPPYAVACYVLDKEARRIGRIQYRNNLRTYAECHERGEWPGYPGNIDLFEPEIRELNLPPWGMKGAIS